MSPIPTPTPMPDGSILTWAGWLGIGGIAQILAAIFAVVTILQARRMIKDADQQRRESVWPHWEVAQNSTDTSMFSGDSNRCVTNIYLQNVGYGSAREIKGKYEHLSGTDLSDFHAAPLRKGTTSVLVDESYVVSFKWDPDLLFTGRVKIDYSTRLGERKTDEFFIETYADEQGKGQCRALYTAA